MIVAYTVYSKPVDIAGKLSEMGLTEQALIDSVKAGHEAAATTTRHHPKNHAGFIAWSEAIKTLRDFLVVAPHKWEPDDIKGQPLVVSPNGSVAVTVSAGDEMTGRLGDRPPKTSSTKGPVTINAVASNVGWLFPELELGEITRINTLKKRETWILLVARDDENQEIRSELSCPIVTDEAGRINGWSTRIILSSVPYGDQPKARSREPDDSNQSAEIKVNITRKA